MGETFGDLLRELRLAAGMTQTRLADLSGVSVQAISLLERGQRTQPRVRTVALLADALDLSDPDRERLQASVVRPGVVRVPLPALASDDVPRSLPPVVGDFTGRSDQVELITGLLTSTGAQGPGSAVVVSAIEGMGGIGKTTLAVRVAHLVADEFPDGQLYVNLQGFGPGEPMPATEALGRLLGMLGTSATGDEAQASARYRTMLADKRMLVVLDNARDADQVVPLLPGTAGSAAIVTSRRSLSTLPGAKHVQLDVLTEDEGIALLSAIIGADRAQAESASVADVVRRCARLPLAIRMAGARLAARPAWPVSVLADQLADERRRLDELEVLDAGVRASFLASVRGLQQSPDPVDRAAATGFPLLGILDTPDLSTQVAARILDRPVARSQQILERLVDSHLLDTPAPGRYHLHDLLRTYARDYARSRIAHEEHIAVMVRVLRLYNTVAWQAHADSSPHHVRLRYRADEWSDILPNGLGSEPVAWLNDERANAIAVLQQVAETPDVPQQLIAQLAMASMHYMVTGGYWHLLAEVGRLALRVATISGDRIAQAFAQHDIGAAMSQLDRGDKGVDAMRAAVDLFRGEGDDLGEAMASCNLAYTLERVGRLEEGTTFGERALRLSVRHELRQLEATTCLALGLLHGRLGQRAQELEYHRRSSAIYIEIGYKRGQAQALYNLGVVHRSAGRIDEAVAALWEAIGLCDQLDLTSTGADARTELAALRTDAGRPELAIELCDAALMMASSVGSEVQEARARHMMGTALHALGRADDALREWSTAAALFDRLGAATADEVRRLVTSVTGTKAGR